MASTRKRLDWAAQALDDLCNIEEYRSQHHSRATADRALSAIRESAFQLGTYPLIGKASPFDSALRHLAVTRYPYVIVYRVTPESVEILHVWDQSQNYLAP